MKAVQAGVQASDGSCDLDWNTLILEKQWDNNEHFWQHSLTTHKKISSLARATNMLCVGDMALLLLLLLFIGTWPDNRVDEVLLLF